MKDLHNGSIVIPVARGKIAGRRFEDDVADALNALLTIVINQTDSLTPKASISSNGVVIEIPKSGGGGSGGSRFLLTECKITSLVIDDYVMVKAWNGSYTIGYEFPVAKKFQARLQFGPDAPYTITDDNNRTGNSGEVQVLSPSYNVGDSLWTLATSFTDVFEPDGHGGTVEVGNLDYDSRFWCHQVGIAVAGGVTVYVP